MAEREQLFEELEALRAERARQPTCDMTGRFQDPARVAKLNQEIMDTMNRVNRGTHYEGETVPSL